jgi:hypothetical protein
VAVAVGLALGGCGSGSEESSSASSSPATDRPAETRDRPEASRPDAEAPALPDTACPAGLEGCRSVSGRIVYVERVDPDGDGDAHFVLASEESVTLPRISVVDVSRELRPHPLPGPGDYLSAAGPVRTGSYGQRQVEAVVVRAVPR